MPKTRKQYKKQSGGTRKNIFGFKKKNKLHFIVIRLITNKEIYMKT